MFTIAAKTQLFFFVFVFFVCQFVSKIKIRAFRSLKVATTSFYTFRQNTVPKSGIILQTESGKCPKILYAEVSDKMT